ncbi:hypothetical protein ACFQ9X_44715 [Catenulispora yoronensis]
MLGRVEGGGAGGGAGQAAAGAVGGGGAAGLGEAPVQEVRGRCGDRDGRGGAGRGAAVVRPVVDGFVAGGEDFEPVALGVVGLVAGAPGTSLPSRGLGVPGALLLSGALPVDPGNPRRRRSCRW